MRPLPAAVGRREVTMELFENEVVEEKVFARGETREGRMGEESEWIGWMSAGLK